MPWSRRIPLVRSSSFGEVGVQTMDPPVAIMKKKRPAVAVEAAGQSKGRNIRPVAQEKGIIKNLNCKLVEEKEEEEKDLKSSILTLGLSYYEENEDGDVDYSFGGFLKSCSFCKKRITRNMDVYMYGYLKAFCSPECRDAQIAIDESLRPPSPIPTLFSKIAEMAVANNAANITSSKSGLGSNVNNHSVSISD